MMEISTLRTYTARYTKLSSGYIGQIIEWPEVVTEGQNLEDCREMLRDALHEMVLAYRQMNRPVPSATGLTESITVEVDDVRQSA
jgi:predicted RNase H-like HicB family nuclease